MGSAPAGPGNLAAMEAQTPTNSISQRLLTMKFMQRAAASEPSSPSTPTTDQSTGKRRKTSHTPITSSPSTPLFDTRAAQAAIDEEEAKREAAVARLAHQLGDAHWVLQGQASSSRHVARTPLKVVHVGFSQIDSLDLSDDPDGVGSTVRGKRSFGAKAEQKTSQKESETKPKSKRKASDSGSDSSTSDGGDGNSEEARPEPDKVHRNGYSPYNSQKRKKAQQFAEKRRKKEVNLNKPVSISSAGAGVRSSR